VSTVVGADVLLAEATKEERSVGRSIDSLFRDVVRQERILIVDGILGKAVS